MFARDRGALGQNLLSFPNTSTVIADSVADSLAARTLVDQCRAQHVTGDLEAPTASLAKFWCTDMQNKVVDRCLQIYGGSNEIMNELLARAP